MFHTAAEAIAFLNRPSPAEEQASRLTRDAEWAAAFTCADPSGATAPCAGNPDLRVRSWDAPRFQRCPIAARLHCEPWRREQERREAERLDAAIAADLERRLARRIPERFLDADLEADAQTPAVVAVRQYLAHGAQHGEALALLGPVGVGKTQAIAGAVAAWPRRALFVEADTIARLVARDHDQLRELIKRAESASLLGLDDLFRGHVKAGGLAEGVLEELLCYRHAHLLPTLVSCNATPDEFARRLSPRVRDRMREWARIIALPGQSLRGKA